jgi:tungstate transport system substrate-binding protein
MRIYPTFKHLASVFIACAAMEITAISSVQAQSIASSIVVASTTSTEQSGLFGYLLPEFKKASGIDVKVVALGTGQALDMGRRGDADVLFVHDQAAEEKIVAEGFALKRYPVMYNDFVLIGPASDPANVRATVKGKDIIEALKKVAAANGNFISRGDKSGLRLQRMRLRHGAGAEHGVQPGGVCAGRPWYVAELQKPGQFDAAGRG